MKSALATPLSVLLVFAATAAAGPVDDPFGYFNLYSLGDVGSASAPYQGEIIGVAGAAGNVYFSSALHGHNSSTGYALHAGGSAALTGTYLGSLDVGGNVRLGGAGVAGSLVAGGDVTSSAGGAIGGDVIAAGAISLPESVIVNGTRQSGVAYTPRVNHEALSDYFAEAAMNIGLREDTGQWTEDGGHIRFQGQAGVNVITVDAATLKGAWAVTIEAPEGAVVYVNVPDGAVELDGTAWRYEGGLDAADVVLNLPFAMSLDLSSTNAVNVLAPFATTYFDCGLLAGTLVVGDLQGGGQINPSSFEQGDSIPEPGAMAVLALGGVTMLARARRRS